MLDRLGIDGSQRIIYRTRKFLSPFTFFFSEAGRRLRQEGFVEVAVLWNDQEGLGQANVNRTALLLSPKGFLAVSPDGMIHRQRTLATLEHEARRTIYSMGALVLIFVSLRIPAALLRLFKR
jgi:hypothetical protein